MPRSLRITLELPEEASLRLPDALERRLHDLLDRQDRGEALTENERREAEGLIEIAELLSFLRLRSQQ